MIKHAYVNASDNVAQWHADKLERQEITLDFYLENLVDEPVFLWTGENGIPWRMTYNPLKDMKIGYRLFCQKSSLENV